MDVIGKHNLHGLRELLEVARGVRSLSSQYIVMGEAAFNLFTTVSVFIFQPHRIARCVGCLVQPQLGVHLDYEKSGDTIFATSTLQLHILTCRL